MDIFETVLHMSSFPITNSLEDPLSFVKYLYHLSTDNAAGMFAFAWWHQLSSSYNVH